MQKPLEVFQSTVFGAHIKMPWAIRFRNTLKFIEAHPEYQIQVGIIPAGQNTFFINSSVCAQFFGLKNRNSLNRDLKQHGFVSESSYNTTEQLRTLCPQLTSVSRCWGKRRFVLGDFNGEISITQAERASNHAREVRSRNFQIDTLTVPIAPQTLPLEENSNQNEMKSEVGGRITSDKFTTEIDLTEGIEFDWENQDWLDLWE
jgi:hypothetical protein